MGGLLGLEKQVKANIYQIGWGILRNGLVIFGIWLVPSLEMFLYGKHYQLCYLPF